MGLSECEVFSYTPDIDSDPHATDTSDEEDEFGSTSDEASSTDDEETTFEFDDYDVDEIDEACPSSPISPLGGTSPTRATHIPFKKGGARHGALLWSSQWFFLNRKLKRILFISIWARSKGIGRSWHEYGYDAAEKEVTGERFFGWEGGVGAGARAMGLGVTA